VTAFGKRFKARATRDTLVVVVAPESGHLFGKSSSFLVPWDVPKISILVKQLENVLIVPVSQRAEEDGRQKLAAALLRSR